MKHLVIASLGLSILIISSCLGVSTADSRFPRNTVDNENTGDSKTSDSALSEWTKIDLLTEQAEILFSDNERVFALGVDGLVEIGANYDSKRIDLPSKISQLLTKDGGLSLIPPGDESKKDKNKPFGIEDLCHPESAVLIGYRLYSVGPCEHTAQLWSFGLEKRKGLRSFTIGFTYATYPNSDTDDPVYAPNSVIKVTDKVIFPSQLRSGPAILVMPNNSMTLKTLWLGKDSDGSVLSVDFVGTEGVMLMSKGSIMRSNDGGTTWNKFAEIPQEFIGKVWQVKFRNPSEGYVIGQDGIILHSSDAGKTWKQEVSNSKGSLYKIGIDKDRAIILEDFRSLYVSEYGKEWKKLDFENNVRIDDILLHDGKLFVLSQSKLYVHQK